ncbi:MAG: superoxide dismutase family protein [Casimicrobiaceae bacterium]
MIPRRLCACAVAVVVAACAAPATRPAAGPTASLEAFALLVSTHGYLTNGSVRFVQEGDRVLVSTDVHNLPPDSVHGLHVHETGDCSAPDAMSAGGHFNPDHKPHGPQQGPHHAGDLPSLRADANGVASVTFVVDDISVSAGPHSIVGKALIVDAGPDDYTTQPTGNSGARVACGVIALR